MSTSDQDQAVETPIPGPEADPETGPGADPEAGAETGPEAVAKAEPAAETEPAADEEPGADEEAVPDEGTGADEEAGGRKLTPRQARRLRMVLSSVGMAAMAVVLALRIASRSSVLVVGVYGLALILCGIVIELSRNGRTRLGSWLLAVGLVAAIGSDWLLIP
ncbi:hypothetical protein ACFC5Z_23960 [Streptomyces sp. NPDC056004]|uniref:hypothetical protein n=1 Tax=Streptomyces sp. NPDC056004 TaxID=3345677 RepID=UPI0035DD654B